MIERFNKNDGFRAFASAVFSMSVLNLLYSIILTAFPSIEGDAVFWCANAIMQLALVGVVLAYCKVRNISVISAASLRQKPRALDLLCVVGIGVGALAFMLPLQNFLVMWLESMGINTSVSLPIDDTAGNIVLLVVIACVMPAFCEEFVFRGVLGNGLAELGIWRASVIGGLLFSLFHMNPAQTLHQFVMGFLFVFYILASGSFWTSFAAHLLNNLLTIVLTLTLGKKIDAWSMEYWCVFMLAGIVVAVPLFLVMCKKSRFVDREKEEYDVKQKNETIFLFAFALFVCVLFWVAKLF